MTGTWSVTIELLWPIVPDIVPIWCAPPSSPKTGPRPDSLSLPQYAGTKARGSLSRPPPPRHRLPHRHHRRVRDLGVGGRQRLPRLLHRVADKPEWACHGRRGRAPEDLAGIRTRPPQQEPVRSLVRPGAALHDDRRSAPRARPRRTRAARLVEGCAPLRAIGGGGGRFRLALLRRFRAARGRGVAGSASAAARSRLKRTARSISGHGCKAGCLSTTRTSSS